jgi:hypothetical protein
VSNTSATGGYLRGVSGPIDGLALRRFVGSAIAGVSGIDPTLVRPAWQPNPPPMPGIETNWVAYAITSRKIDNDPYQKERIDGSGSIYLRHEEIEFLLTFYGPDCLQNAADLRDSFKVSQNLETFFLNNMTIVRFGDIMHVPELYNDRWYDRADMTMLIRREVNRVYPILSILKAQGSIVANKEFSVIESNFETK